MFQVIFNEISAAELSKLPTLEQLTLLAGFKVTEDVVENPDGQHFGTIEKDGHLLYRYRAGEYRIYFAIEDGNVVVHRVLHAKTLKDFLFRSKLGGGEDEDLAKNKHFWQLIAEGQNARKEL